MSIRTNKLSHRRAYASRRRPRLESLEARYLLAAELLSGAGTTSIAVNAEVPLDGVISDDGRYLVSDVDGANVFPGLIDNNRSDDVYLHDRLLGTTTLVSHIGDGVTTGNATSLRPLISGDGSTVYFVSRATDLVAGFIDNNGVNNSDVFRYDVATGVVSLASHISGNSLATGNGGASVRSVSDDGTRALITSQSTDLIAGLTDNNGGTFTGTDGYLYDSVSDTNSLINHIAGDPLTTSTEAIDIAVLSGDGTAVAYESRGADLVAGFVQAQTGDNIFLYDVATGANTLVSHEDGSPLTGADGLSDWPQISDDGNTIAYQTHAENLDVNVGDGNSRQDVYVYDVTSGINTLISHTVSDPLDTGDEGGLLPNISDDGSRVVYQSNSSDLITGFVDGAGAFDRDLFLYTIGTGSNQLISHAAGSTTTGADNLSFRPRISTDGLTIVFESQATNIIAGQNNTNGSTKDVFVYDVPTTTAVLATRTFSSPTTTAARGGADPAVSGDGSTIAYESESGDLISGQTAEYSLFAFDVTAGTNELMSKRTGTPSVSAAGDSSVADQTFFFSHTNVFVSDSGRYSVFVSFAGNVVPGQVDPGLSGDIFVYDRQLDIVSLVTHTGDGVTVANGTSFDPVINGDGTKVVYSTLATDLQPGIVDPNNASFGLQDVYIYDIATGTNTLVSHVPGSPATTGNERSEYPRISGDGSKVAFHSRASDLVTGFVDGSTASATDLFVYDVATGSISLASHTGDNVTGAAGRSEGASLSNDGSLITFRTTATNVLAGVTDTNNALDHYLYDTATGNNVLISHAASSATTTGDRQTGYATISGDGTAIVLVSDSTDLVAGMTDANATNSDVFAYDVATGNIRLVSHIPGDPLTSGSNGSDSASISDNAARIAFASRASDLVSGVIDVNGGSADVFAWEAATNEVSLVSHQAGFPNRTADAGIEFRPALSDDGRTIAWNSEATNVVSGVTDVNAVPDIFIRDLTTGDAFLASPDLADPNATPEQLPNNSLSAREPSVAGDGSMTVYDSRLDRLVADDFNESIDVFGFARDVITPPAVDLSGGDQAGINFGASFTEDGGAVAITDSDLTVTDGLTMLGATDDLNAATVTISNLADGADEVLSADTTGTSIVASYAAGVLTLSGIDTVANYETVLRSVTYDNSSQNPSTTDRSVHFVVSTSSADSDIAVSTVAVIADNDDPTVTVDNAAVAVFEGDTAVNAGTFGDIDPGLSVTVSASIGLISQDTGTSGNWSWSFDTNDGPDETQTVVITATDDQGGSSQVTFDLVVNNVPPTLNMNVTFVDEGTPTIVNVTAVNDPGMDTITAFTVDWGDGDIEVYATPGPFVHTYDDGPFMPDIRVEATDEDGTLLAGFITQTIFNADPTANPDTPTASEDGGVIMFDVLANDTDPAGAFDPLTVTGFDDTGTLGLVTNNGDGTFDYDPNGQFESLASGESATDVFTYTIDDGDGGTDTGTVTITVNGANDDPSAVDDSGVGFATDEETAFTTPDVIANDSDIDASDTLVVSAIDTSGTLGSVTDNGDGTFDYDPVAAFQSLAVGETANDTFGYTVSDGNGGTDNAVVTVAVSGINDAPTISDDTFSVDEGSATGAVVGTVSAADVDTSDTLAFAITAGNPNNAFDIDSSGVITVDNSAELDFDTTPSYTLTVEVSDGNGGFDTATVTVNVNEVIDGVTLVDGELTVPGTPGDDVIEVTRTFTEIVISVNGQPDQTFPIGDVDSIVIILGDGNDDFDLGPFIFIDATIIGGDGNDTISGGWGDDTIIGGPGDDDLSGSFGNDTIRGGAGNDVINGNAGSDTIFGGGGGDILLGGFGGDTINGGGGRDLLIGGFGSDVLDGRNGQDILIGSITTHDGDNAALKAIRQVWTSTDSYNDRVNTIRTGSGAILNGVSLDAGTTVLNDFASDTLTGNNARDWFFAHQGGLFGFDDDVLLDQMANEQVDLF